MPEELTFHSVCGGSGELDLIFVHGLWGDPNDTWMSSSEPSEYWPTWLCNDFPNLNVFALGYPASLFGKWAKKEMNLFERAKSVLEHLSASKIGTRPIAFVTHSLGGILVKQVLRTANDVQNDTWGSIAKNTRLVAFLGTPHSGAGLAAVLSNFASRFTSTHVAALTNEYGQLSELNESYRQFAPKSSIATLAYYEKFKINGTLLVDQQSADPGVYQTVPVGIDADHISICKPKDRDAPIYRSLYFHIGKCIDGLNQNPAGDVAAQIGVSTFEKDD